MYHVQWDGGGAYAVRGVVRGGTVEAVEIEGGRVGGAEGGSVGAGGID